MTKDTDLARAMLSYIRRGDELRTKLASDTPHEDGSATLRGGMRQQAAPRRSHSEPQRIERRGRDAR